MGRRRILNRAGYEDDDLIGRTLAHYQITEAIGAGGMGQVFRATDTKLGRDVALKVLPPDMARDPERLARFQREARAVAALNHPHIVTIFSVEEAEGVHFLTMELVEGQSLDRRIPPGGLAIEQITAIAAALADALAAAHEKGIVHRDLKPANVMVTDEGRVKVLDFGLAKDVRAENASNATLTSVQTQVGVVMGTPAYMSPEQISGRALDHRTDIFSLGVMLHEMSTGHRPFRGASSAELISCIIRDNPASVTDARPDLSSDLARVIRRCLEKDPRHRMQTARDVSNEFRDMAPTASRPVAESTSRVAVPDSGAARTDEGFWVAVLPFKYANSNEDLKALAEGLSEEVITGLSRFSYLRVVARGSTAKYSSESGDIRATGKELGARYVMEGSIRQAGSKLRLAVQLVDATTGSHLWAETYERTFSPESVFVLQDELVPRIVSTIADAHGILPHTLGEGIRGKNPEHLTPYEAVWRAFSYAERISPQEHVIVRDALERAVALAPTYAYAWAMLSLVIKDEYESGFNPKPDPLERMLEAARRAVELDPSGHRGYHALAMTHFYRKEIPAFRTTADRALMLNPMDGCNVGHLGSYIAYAGEWERGCDLVEHAARLNPNHPSWFWFPLSLDAYRKGDYRGALAYALKINLPNFHWTHSTLAAIYGQLGQREEARKAVQELLKLNPHAAQMARTALQGVFEPDFAEHLLDGLHKAGLEIPDEIQVTAQTSPASRSTSPKTSGAARAHEGFWVAVLPFKGASGDAELEALADGLTEDVTSGLSRFSYLQVIASNSTVAYKGRAADIRIVGSELGARYVLEGSIRKRGRAVRVGAQLMDALNGTQLWAESYDRELRDAGSFEIQDDLTDHIVAAVADGYGVLVRSMAGPTRGKKVEELSASELVLRDYAFMQQVNPQEHGELRAGFERALEREPNHADAWACLSNLYQLEYFNRFNPLPNSLERARDAAWRAVKIDPASQMGWRQLAAVQFFSRDFTAFRETAERAMSLNPRDGTTWAYMAIMIGYSGDWERGVALMQRTMDLNRHHPGWYNNIVFAYHYRKGEYEAALLAAKKINMPEYHWMHLMTAAASAMLAREEEARTAVESLRKYSPMFLDLKNVREDIEIWDPGKNDVERFMQGLQKAGLQYGSADAAAPQAAATASGARIDKDSGAVRADEGFWVAVLPFKSVGAVPELAALADGLSEEIVAGLSRFSYLRVMTRSSTTRYANQAADQQTLKKELGARYVMEGSLRLVASKLRVAVQLVDTISGAHLWAHTYERAFAAEEIFALQDDLVPRIVSTLADQYGVLPRSMTEVVRNKDEASVTPHEAVLRAFSYFERISLEEHLRAKRSLERAVMQAPDQADCWAMLSMMFRGEYVYGFNVQPDSLERALTAARRAVQFAPTNHLAYFALASTLFFQKDRLAFRVAAKRCIELNPMDGSTTAYLGFLIAASGEWDYGIALVESGVRLNPNYPGWYNIGIFANAYHKGQYQDALDAALAINLPGSFHSHAARAAALGQLGCREQAQASLRELLVIRPDFANAVRQEYAKFYEPEVVEHLVDGLRKAGLEISAAPTA